MRKFLITAELRALEKQVSKGEISYGKMIEILNEKAEEYHLNKQNSLIGTFTVSYRTEFSHKCDDEHYYKCPNYKCDYSEILHESNFCANCGSKLNWK